MKKALIIFAIVLACFSAIFAQEGPVKNNRHIDTLISDKQYDKDLAEVDKLLQLDTIQNNDTLNAICFGLKGNILFNQEKYTESIPILKKACNLFEKARYKRYEYLDALFFLPASYHRLEDYENAERYYRKALIKSVSLNVDSINKFREDIYFNLGNIYKRKGLEKMADACFERAHSENKERVADIDMLNFKIWQNSLWDTIDKHISNQQYQEAIDVYTEMIYGIEETIGKGDLYAFAVYSKALLLRAFINNIDEAMPLFKEVIDLKETIPFPNTSVCGAYCDYALCLATKNDFDKIEKILPFAISYLSEAHNENHPVHMIYRFIGNGAYWNENYLDAIKYYEKYLDPTFPKEAGNSYDEITNMLAVAYIRTNNPDKAEELLLNYIKQNSGNLKVNHELASNIYHNLGRSYMLQGDCKKTLKFLNLSKKIQIQLYGQVSPKTQQYIIECEAK